MKKIHVGDTVQVIAGKFVGAIGPVKTFVGEDRVVITGVNLLKKAVKGQGFVEKEGSLHVSNIMPYDASASQASRIGIRLTKKGKKERFYKKTGNAITA